MEKTKKKRKSLVQSSTSAEKKRKVSGVKPTVRKAKVDDTDKGYTNVSVPGDKTAKWTNLSDTTKTSIRNIVTQNASYVLQNIPSSDLKEAEKIFNELQQRIEAMMETTKAPPPNKKISDYSKIYSNMVKLGTTRNEYSETLGNLNDAIDDAERKLSSMSTKKTKLLKEVTALERETKRLDDDLPMMHPLLVKYQDVAGDDKDDDDDDDDVNVYIEQLTKTSIQVTEALAQY